MVRDLGQARSTCERGLGGVWCVGGEGNNHTPPNDVTTRMSPQPPLPPHHPTHHTPLTLTPLTHSPSLTHSLTLSAASTLAPALTSRSTHPSWPLYAALMRAVSPYCTNQPRMHTTTWDKQGAQGWGEVRGEGTCVCVGRWGLLVESPPTHPHNLVIMTS